LSGRGTRSRQSILRDCRRGSVQVQEVHRIGVNPARRSGRYRRRVKLDRDTIRDIEAEVLALNQRLIGRIRNTVYRILLRKSDISRSTD